MILADGITLKTAGCRTVKLIGVNGLASSVLYLSIFLRYYGPRVALVEIGKQGDQDAAQSSIRRSIPEEVPIDWVSIVIEVPRGSVRTNNR